MIRKDKVKAFIITPLDKSGERIRDTINRNLPKLGIELINMKTILESTGNITELILLALEQADFIIVDISRHNPNVMYELGYAHALRKPTIIIADKDEITKIPIDVSGHYVLVYDRNNFRSFIDNLKSSTLRIKKRLTGEGV